MKSAASVWTKNEAIRIRKPHDLSPTSRTTRSFRKYINVLGEAVDMVGGPQIRNAGTIGGNTCNGVTSADSASTLHAWEAIIELTGKNGKRYLPIKDFYIQSQVRSISTSRTARFRQRSSFRREAPPNTAGHYIKYAMRNAMDIATTGCSVNAVLSPGIKRRSSASASPTALPVPVPMRAPSAEEAAKAKRPVNA